MRARRVAPPAVVAVERVVGRTKVGRGDEDRRLSGQAPLRVVHALHLEARAARKPAVEERGAQRRGVGAVALAVEVSVAARASWG